MGQYNILNQHVLDESVRGNWGSISFQMMSLVFGGE